MSETNEMLARLLAVQKENREKRTELTEKRAAIVRFAKDEGREDLTDDEDTEFNGLTEEIKSLDLEHEQRDERVHDLADEEERAKNAVVAVRRAQLVESQIRVTAESRMYEKGNGRSYFGDLIRALGPTQDQKSRMRLEQHGLEMATDAVESRVNPNRTDGQGGYFVPPLWLMDQYAALARAGRATANLVTNLDLPAGTDSINIPLVLSGTTAAPQTADGGAVSDTDVTDNFVTAPVKTIAGQQEVAIQLMEQSPVNFDEIIFADLIAAYNTQVDIQVINGSNASGQVKGLLTASGTNAITYTDTTPTVPELYSKLADGTQQIHTGRFMAPTVMVMHPRRWAWFLASLDSSNRPLVVPNTQGPFNAIGSFTDVTSQAVVGSIQGLPVVTDPSIPTNLGAGTNQDPILIMRASDLLLWEGGIRTRVLPDVLSANLQIRLQVYGYVAFTAERYPKAISVVNGTGLVAPTF